MSMDCDVSQDWLDQVNQALKHGTALRIQGGNSKAMLGRRVEGEVLDTRCHRGLVSYDPTELVLTARAGTPLVEIEAALHEAGQMLPCEPPHLSDEATLGGMVAAGLSGPRRPWAGAVRDYVLGTRVITGHGKLLRFGGEVMKNVAGYDVSRLLAGSFGCLGLVTEVSLKVLPRPRQCLSLRMPMSRHQALAELATWGQQPLPISAACHEGETLYLRLEGGELLSIGTGDRGRSMAQASIASTAGITHRPSPACQWPKCSLTRGPSIAARPPPLISAAEYRPMHPAKRVGNQRLTSPGIMPCTTATPIPASTALATSAQALSNCSRHRQARAMALRPASIPPCSLTQRLSQGCSNGTRPMHSTGSAVSSAACW